MICTRIPRRSALLAGSLFAASLASAALAAGPVTVQLNGSTLNLSPPPTERAGRVFVPLRGVFENLGASVVYANGTINAQGRGHSVQLRIGSQQATVDGRALTVDVAPFIVGASTYVPLRFVSQALGATVNWDNANRVVAISTGGAPVAQTVTPVATQAPGGNASPVQIGNLLPRRGATIRGDRPTIQATFENGRVDPNSIHVELDGRDVTNNAYISARGITYTPPPLPAGRHEVRIAGHDANGASFDRAWSFTSGSAGANAVANEITNVRPQPDATVSNAFTVSGHTVPGATVTVQVGVAQSGATNIGQLVGAILGAGGGGNTSVQNTVTADANGNFSSAVEIGAPSGSVLAVVITSTDPNYGVAATPVRFNLRVR